MASNLLKTLKKIDDGRLECIRIAKELGHDVSDNASLQDIASCLVEAGYPKYYPSVDIDEVKAGRKKWVRPDYMYDLEPIFNAAESFTGEDGNVYYPLYVMSFRTSYESIQINKNNLCASGTIAVKTSDGVTYENAQITTTAFTHTWDSTKTDKYYIVVYGIEAYYNKTTAIKVSTALNYYEAMEVYLGAGYYGQIEAGTSQMSIDTLIKVSHTAHLPMEYILFGTGYEPASPDAVIDMLHQCSERELELAKKMLILFLSKS